MSSNATPIFRALHITSMSTIRFYSIYVTRMPPLRYCMFNVYTAHSTSMFCTVCIDCTHANRTVSNTNISCTTHHTCPNLFLFMRTTGVALNILPTPYQLRLHPAPHVVSPSYIPTCNGPNFGDGNYVKRISQRLFTDFEISFSHTIVIPLLVAR